MNIGEINALFASDAPSEMRLLAATEYARSISLAFAWHGGPNEDEELVVTFDDAGVFHLPAILYIDSLRMRPCSAQRVRELVPAVSYDESEHGSDGGYKVVEFTDASDKPLGYYVMAMEVSSERTRVPRAA